MHFRINNLLSLTETKQKNSKILTDIPRSFENSVIAPDTHFEIE